MIVWEVWQEAIVLAVTILQLEHGIWGGRGWSRSRGRCGLPGEIVDRGK